jgi:glyoxylase-like metal-dependent hydrolase (beta-lactamase superfamily II)
MSWDVGGALITRLVEQVMSFAVDFFAEASPKDVATEVAANPWLAPDFVDATGRYLINIQTFVIEAGSQRIVVDTCAGNSKARPLIPEFDHQDGPFLANLAAAGFAPETIDIVVCTHLHVDHVGWNTRLVDGQWIPTFPRARYLFGAADLTYWASSDDPLHAPAFADSVRHVVDAGLAESVAKDTALTSDIRLSCSPGHTPGHMSVWVGDRCVITGDVLHHPIQCRRPEWTARGDADPDIARATRRKFLATSAQTNALVLGTHFAGSSAGRIRPVDNGYSFVPATAATFEVS